MTEKRGVSKAELKRFKRAYERAKRDKVDPFEFEGKQYVLKYAYYMIQYLDGIAEKKK